jgi:four helix bundle protein
MAKDFTELDAWKLAREVKLRAYALAKRPDVARDFDFVQQVTDAAASGPRNIAEGFGRFDAREFANFLKIAISSELEVRNHFIDAFDKGYFNEAERDDAIALTRRAVTAAARLRRYLLSPRNPYRLRIRRGTQ